MLTLGAPAPPTVNVPRHRLTDRLTRAARGPLTVVVAAPGTGKTVLAASWAASDGPAGPVAWASLHDVGADAGTLQARVHTALRDAGAEPAVLILDDVQDVRGPALHELLDAVGPEPHVVLLSRTDPPIPLHRYRLTGALTELRTEDLAFTDREAHALFTAHGVDLPAPAVRALRERTEGWAAGLRLAALAAAGRDPEAAAQEFGGDDPAVVAYLAAEVLDPLPPEARRLLLALSVADRFDTALAAALTGADEAFPALVRDLAFIRPLGHGWYRYHRMLRDALRLTLHHEHPSDVPDLHRRAAAWFARHGTPAEAVRHAVLAGDWRYASWLLVDGLAIGAVLGLTDGPPPEDLLAGLDVNATGTEPEPALVAAAVAAARGDDAACAEHLRRAEDLMSALPAAPPAARLAAGLIRLCRPGLPPQSALTALVTELDGLLSRLPCGPLADHPEIPALVRYAHGTAELRAGRPAAAAESLRAALPGLEPGGAAPRLRCLGMLALAEALGGRFGQAARWTARAARIPAPPGRPVAAAHLAQAWTDLMAYRLDAARRSLDAAHRALDAAPDPPLSALATLVAVRLDAAYGRPPSATGPRRVRPAWLHRRLLLSAAEAHTAAGDPAAALEEIRAAGDATPDARVALARARLALGDPRAPATLHPVLVESAPLPAEVRVEAWLLDARQAYAADDQLRGRRSLARALRLAEREGLRLPFAAARAWLPAVLRQDPELLRPHRRFLNGLGPHDAPPGVPPEAPAGCTAHVELSARELEVLHLLAGMRTSEEIATEMYVSVNTVKTHLRSIYRKLAVTRRGEAVRRARHLELL